MTLGWIRIGFCVLLLCGCSGERAGPAATETGDAQPGGQLVDGSQVTAELYPLDDGQWRVDYVFETPQTALIFSRSNGDYRTASWEALGGAPAIERIGGFDAMVFGEPVTQASYVFEPHAETIRGDYDPFLSFSDGGLAMFTGQFELLPSTGREAIINLDGNLNSWTGEQPSLGVRLIADVPVLHQGQVYTDELEWTSLGGGTYAYLGEANFQEGRSFTGVIDSALPEFIRGSFDDDLGAIFSAFETRWGFSLLEKATVYFAFGGYELQGYSGSGSVLNGDLIVLNIQGSDLRTPSPELRVRSMWFFAHEAAHMFQGVGQGQIGSTQHAWWHEGSANTMAHDILLKEGIADRAYIVSEYAVEVSSCAQALEAGPVLAAQGETPYHCGDLYAVMADAALPNATLYDIWRAWTARFKNKAEAATTTSVFFEVMTELGASEAFQDHLHSLIHDTHEDGAAAIYRGFDLAGVQYELDSDGKLVDITLP